MPILRLFLLWFYKLFGLEAKRLNLRVTARTHWSWHMAKIGDHFIAKIAPTNAAGAPSPVTGVVFTATAGYSVAPASDGLSAVLTATTPGTSQSVTVTAITKSGATLTETATLADIETPPVDEEAVKLNLTVA